jgi:hypothetical protein
MKDKILGLDSSRTCLFCGQKEKQKWDEYEYYYECDCPDAVECRRIDEEIRKLNQKRPRYKYEIIKQSVLRKL